MDQHRWCASDEKRRAKKELDVLFDYLSNNGIVMQKDILKLVGIAITKSIKVKLEKIAKRLDKHEHLDRTKFVNIFTEIFYMKPLLKLITSEHKVEEQISGPVELTSMIQTYLRRQKFKTIHNRFDTGKEERAAERRRIALRKKMAGNMFDAARITKTIRRRNSILDSFEKHKKSSPQRMIASRTEHSGLPLKDNQQTAILLVLLEN